MPTYRTEKAKEKTVILLFVLSVLFKLACDIGYWELLAWDTTTYRADFSLVKYCLGCLWCVVLFFGIEHTDRKASSFLLLLFYLLQIIPLTTIYSLGNDSSIYYHSICLCVLFCELLVRLVAPKAEMTRNRILSAVMVAFLGLIAAYTIYRMVLFYGRPEMTALNIYKVYDMRRDAPNLGKLVNYLLAWTMPVILPFALAKALTIRKWLAAAAICAVIFLVYLYTGQKTFLFSVPMVVACTLWAKRENCYLELFSCLCIGFAVLVVLSCMESNRDQGIFNRIYSLIGRRCMILTANNKFKYYDYFTKHPKMGIYGIFPRWLIEVKSYYENIPYSYEISKVYFGKPEMNSNTGFLAEGYMRFGHLGTLAALTLFAVILKLVDRFAERTSYQLAVGLFAFRVFGLADAHLIDSLFFGEWMLLILLLLFYGENGLKHTERKLSPLVWSMDHNGKIQRTD